MAWSGAVATFDRLGGVDLPDDSICALTDHVLNVVLLRHIEGDFPRAAAACWCARHCGGVMGYFARVREAGLW